MFTDKTQRIIDSAKNYAFSNKCAELDLSAVVSIMRNDTEASTLLAECVGLSPEKLHTESLKLLKVRKSSDKLSLTESMRNILVCAKELAAEVPNRHHPGLIDLRHLVCAIGMSSDVYSLLDVTPISREDAEALLAVWYQRDTQSPSLEELTERLRELRNELLKKVFGQDHAVHAFVEGLFNAEVVAGQKIGVLGDGYTTETDGERKHLHFGIIKGNVISYKGYVDTEPQLEAWIDPLTYY